MRMINYLLAVIIVLCTAWVFSLPAYRTYRFKGYAPKNIELVLELDEIPELNINAQHWFMEGFYPNQNEAIAVFENRELLYWDGYLRIKEIR